MAVLQIVLKKCLTIFFLVFIYFLYIANITTGNEMNIDFLDIYHPLSGGGINFDALINGNGDIHKKRFVWRAKASILLKYLSDKYSGKDII